MRVGVGPLAGGDDTFVDNVAAGAGADAGPAGDADVAREGGGLACHA